MPTQYTPAEALVDPHNPLNDSFYENQRALQRLLVAQSSAMRPTHVQVAKMRLRGLSNAEISEHTQRTQTTISQIARRPDVQQLMATLQFLSALNDGPTIQLRKRKLWEMALGNQAIEPDTAIRAIKEINSMEGVGKEPPNTNVQVIINADQFPRGRLDE